MAPAILCAVCLPLTMTPAQQGAAATPTVTISAKAEFLGDVLARVREQTAVLVAAHPFADRRRVTVEIEDEPLPAALDTLAIAAVATWDCAYLLIPEGGSFGPEGTPPEWRRPPQMPLTLSGGSGKMEDIARTLSTQCAAPVGYLPELESVVIETQATEDAPLEEVLPQLNGEDLTWARGFWLAPIDEAAVFGRYASLPADEREQRVLRHTDQMLRLNRDDVRRALTARYRDFAALDADERKAEIERYAGEVRAGIRVLNTLGSEVRSKARKAMKVFFDIGLDVYRDLTEEEQLETTPIIEAMGELER